MHSQRADRHLHTSWSASRRCEQLVNLTVAVADQAVPTVTNSATVSTPGETTTSNNGASDQAQVFRPQVYSLTVNRSGPGTVASVPVGINCGSACVASFTGGTQVTLTASPARRSGVHGLGWVRHEPRADLYGDARCEPDGDGPLRCPRRALGRLRRCGKWHRDEQPGRHQLWGKLQLDLRGGYAGHAHGETGRGVALRGLARMYHVDRNDLHDHRHLVARGFAPRAGTGPAGETSGLERL